MSRWALRIWRGAAFRAAPNKQAAGGAVAGLAVRGSARSWRVSAARPQQTPPASGYTAAGSSWPRRWSGADNWATTTLTLPPPAACRTMAHGKKLSRGKIVGINITDTW